MRSIQHENWRQHELTYFAVRAGPDQSVVAAASSGGCAQYYQQRSGSDSDRYCPCCYLFFKRTTLRTSRLSITEIRRNDTFVTVGSSSILRASGLPDLRTPVLKYNLVHTTT
jgi:hypothetical protein